MCVCTCGLCVCVRVVCVWCVRACGVCVWCVYVCEAAITHNQTKSVAGTICSFSSEQNTAHNNTLCSSSTTQRRKRKKEGFITLLAPDGNLLELLGCKNKKNIFLSIPDTLTPIPIAARSMA